MKPKRKYVKKCSLETHAVYSIVEKVWQNKNHSYVYSYLRGVAMVNKEDDIHDELMLLSGIQRILAHN